MYISYLSNKFPLPVHAEVPSALRTSYPHSTAKGIRLNEKTSCQEKRRESQETEREKRERQKQSDTTSVLSHTEHVHPNMQFP